jgi:general secretion pathway protein A
MDYLSFHHLQEEPFRLTPDPAFFYPSADHNDALFSLEYVTEQKEGFSLILGSPGTGKTTIVRTFMARWKDKAHIALVMTPRLSPEELLQAILEDLGVKLDTINRNEMIKAFRDILIAKSLEGKRVIIIIDEAQGLSEDTLEELRLLSNLETDTDKLLQIVLVGQPQLMTKLASDGLEQLNQRISVKTVIRALKLKETEEYINYRLIKAGTGRATFTDESIKKIHRHSKGIPRLINLYASRALMAAYVEGTQYVGGRHVAYADKHLSSADRCSPKQQPSMRFGLAGLFLLILLSLMSAGIYLWTQSGTSHAMINEPEAKTAVINTHHIVLASDAFLRQGPSKYTEAISTAKKGAVFLVVGHTDENSGKKWYKVQTSSATFAWISAKVTTPAIGPPELRASL